MESVCFTCGQEAVRYCNSHVPAIPYCEECHKAHKSEHRRTASRYSQHAIDPQPIACTLCPELAQTFCLTAEIFLCGDHRLAHPAECECDWYEVATAAELAGTTEGKRLMKRQKAVMEATELITEKLSGLEGELNEALKAEVESAHQIVDLLGEKCQREIAVQVRALRIEVESYLERLQLFQNDEEKEVGNKLEAVVFTESLAEMRKAILHTEWFRIRLCRAPLDPQEDLFLIERSEQLLEDFEFSCPWADRYMLIPGNPLRFFDVVERGILLGEFPLQLKSGVVWINLPDGRLCAVGNQEDSRICTLDRNFTAYRHVANLTRGRSFAGLAYCSDRVFIFGGGNRSAIENSAELFDFKSTRALLLPTRMITPRHSFCPCVHDGKVFIAGGKTSTLCELFDPQTNEFRLLGSWLPELEPVLTVALDDGRVLIIGQGILMYSLATETIQSISKDVIRVKTQTHPIRSGDSLFFTIRGADLEPTLTFASLSLTTFSLDRLHSIKG